MFYYCKYMSLFTIILIISVIYIIYLIIIENKRKIESFRDYKFTKPNIDLNSIFNSVNSYIRKEKIIDNYNVIHVPIKNINLSKNNIDIKTKDITTYCINSILDKINKNYNLSLKLLSIESINKIIYIKNIELFHVIFFIVLPEKFLSRSISYKYYIINDKLIPNEIKTLQDSITLQKNNVNLKPQEVKKIYRYAYDNPTTFEYNQPHEKIPLVFKAPF